MVYRRGCPPLLLWWVEWEQTTTPVMNGWESWSNELARTVKPSLKVALSPPMVEGERAPPTLALPVLAATVKEW
jgi:hypothetical protein